MDTPFCRDVLCTDVSNANCGTGPSLDHDFRPIVLQVVPALSVTPSTALAAATAPLTFTTAIPSPLAASTTYTYILDKGDGSAVGNCLAYGSTDASNVWTWASAPRVSPTATFSTDRATAYTAVMSVYSSGCTAGGALTAGQAPIAQGTTNILVSGLLDSKSQIIHTRLIV